MIKDHPLKGLAAEGDEFDVVDEGVLAAGVLVRYDATRLQEDVRRLDRERQDKHRRTSPVNPRYVNRAQGRGRTVGVSPCVGPGTVGPRTGQQRVTRQWKER